MENKLNLLILYLPLSITQDEQFSRFIVLYIPIFIKNFDNFMPYNCRTTEKYMDFSQKTLTFHYIHFIYQTLVKFFNRETAQRYFASDFPSCLKACCFNSSTNQTDSRSLIEFLEQADYNIPAAQTRFKAQNNAVLPRDFFHQAYNEIFSRSVRHKQGEYYTPLWLADTVLDALDYSKKQPESLLDPCCGSGVFLISALKRILQSRRKFNVSDYICQNLAGYDTNPLSVLACKANLRLNAYLLKGIELPDNLDNIRCADFLLNQTDNSPLSPQDNNLSRFDLIAGNPPWISWDNLPAEYRTQTSRLWKEFGLFHLTGSAARHGGAKKDLSELIFYAACRRLKSGGKFGMLLPQSLLHNTAAGGFRRWISDAVPLNIQSVWDYAQIPLFNTAAAKTCILIGSKGKPTSYPVPYYIYGKTPSTRFSRRAADAAPDLSCLKAFAAPSNPEDCLSPWQIRETNTLSCTRPLEKNEINYTARLGANSGGANGVFWLKILERIDSRHVRVENIPEKSKRPIEKVQTVIESALLYPLARWKSIDTWRFTSDNTALLVVQDAVTRRGVDRSVLEEKYPQTLEYLLRFQLILEARAAQKRYQKGNEFYSMYNIGTYTFSDWKTIWRRMDKRVRASAVGPAPLPYLPARPVFPQETCVFIPAENQQDACYLAAYLNAAPITNLLLRCSISGGKGFGSPGMLKLFPLPKFDFHNSDHLALAQWGMQMSKDPNNESIQNQIDALVSKWI